MVKIFNLTFPREVCNPKRQVIKDKLQFFRFINHNSSTTNIYTNVYNYSNFKEPYLYPDYESAIIDKIYFDIDQRVKEHGEWFSINAYETMLKIHYWCLEKDIMHFPRCTGSAFDIIILTDPATPIINKKQCVANAQLWLCKELQIKMDRQVVGDIARIFRVDNTFNHKPQTKRFCIPLSPDIIYLGEEKIFEIASKQNFKSNRYGKKNWDIKPFDCGKIMFNDFLDLDTTEIDESQFSDLSGNIPDCIKSLLSTEEIGWQERRVIILCLRDNCYFLEEAIEILRKHLSKKKFKHCYQDEQQLQYLYKNDKYLFPNQYELKELGACPLKLGKTCEKAKFGCLLYGR